jgi:hypothetical protein
MSLIKLLLITSTSALLVQSCSKLAETRSNSGDTATVASNRSDSAAHGIGSGTQSSSSQLAGQRFADFDTASVALTILGRSFSRANCASGDKPMLGSDPFLFFKHDRDRLYLYPDYVAVVFDVQTYAGDSICVFSRDHVADSIQRTCTVTGNPLFNEADGGLWFNGIVGSYLLLDLGTGPDRGFAVNNLADSARHVFFSDYTLDIRVVSPDSIEYGKILKTQPDPRDFPEIVEWRKEGLSPVLAERVVLCLRDLSERKTGYITLDVMQ